MTINALDLLDSGNFQTYNRKVAKELGSVNAAIMLSELVNRYQYHRDRKELLTFKKYEGIWFYYTMEKCQERTVLSRKEQDSAIRVLEKRNLFKKASIGLPAKRHFCLDLNAITAFINISNKQSRMTETDKLDCPKGTDCIDPNGQANKEPHKEPKEEPQIKREGETPSTPTRSSIRSSSKVEREPDVYTTDAEHEKLAETRSPEERDEAYRVLSEWKDDTPKSKWKKSDYRSINRWVFDAIKEKKLKGTKGKSRANPNLTSEQAQAYDELF